MIDSVFCNPFIIGKDGTREEVIEKYELWVNSQPKILRMIPSLKDKVLGCWCLPKKCHCEILAKRADSKYTINWFSNMLPFEKPLLYQGIIFNTVENFYQAMKMPKNKIHLRETIAGMSPHESKRAVRDESKFPIDSEWNRQKGLGVMEYALRWKFQKGTDWHRKLMLSKELGLELVEWNNWGDGYWGKDLKTETGHNMLGQYLMYIRDE